MRQIIDVLSFIVVMSVLIFFPVKWAATHWQLDEFVCWGVFTIAMVWNIFTESVPEDLEY
jgi:hypothetical protein